MINNGNRIERSPIQSVIIRTIKKIGRPRSGSPICYHEYDLQTELDDAMSCYQLIITIPHNSKSSFEKELLKGIVNIIIKIMENSLFQNSHRRLN